MRRLILLFCAVVLVPLAGRPAHAADEADFAAIVVQSVAAVIRPGYDQLAGAAAASASAMDALCRAPSAAALGKAHESFATLVDAWSRVELIRFGPIRDDNRFERIFFWPDRKGIGLRQVQAILAKADRQALDSDGLASASVAVQGLGALEFVLHGDGSSALATGAPDGFRCAYGRAVARRIAANAGDVAKAWHSDAGFVGLMLKPGDDNPVYRTSEEVIRDLLGAMTQELEFVRDSKLATPLGDDASSAKPKRASFWRSNLTLMAIAANVESVRTLFADGGFAGALSADDKWIPDQLGFELKQSLDAWRRIDRPFVGAARDTKQHELMVYSRIPLQAAQKILSSGYAEATGLVLGFNALDGD